MDPLTLHKVLIPPEDHYRLLRAMYAEDLPLLQTYHQNAGQGLDACIQATLEQTSAASKFYKVEMPDGTLMGYFAVATETLEGFFIRVTFRQKIYQDAFINLISETFANSFFMSTSGNNYNAIKELIKYNYEIPTIPFDFNRKNLVLLRP